MAPVQPFDYDDRRLIENWCIMESNQPWNVKPLPQKTAREVRGHVLVTVLMFTQARAYRLPCAQDALGKAPVGWQRWRRPRFEETRNQVMVLAQGY